MTNALAYTPIGHVIRITKSSVSSGDPIIEGQFRGIAQSDTEADGQVEVATPYTCIGRGDVVGEDGAGNAAIAFGAYIYQDGAELNADVTNGTKFAIALGAVSSGATTKINYAVLADA